MRWFMLGSRHRCAACAVGAFALLALTYVSSTVHYAEKVQDPVPPPHLSAHQRNPARDPAGSTVAGSTSSLLGIPAAESHRSPLKALTIVDPANDRRSAPLESTVQCSASNFRSDSWQYRSCKFTNLCYDLGAREFVLFKEGRELEAELRRQNLQEIEHHKAKQQAERQSGASDGKIYPSVLGSGYSDVSSSVDVKLSLSGINGRWQEKDVDRLKWFPTVRTQRLTEKYYKLSDDTVLVPFTSMAGHNVGHLMWDDLLPIYTLLEMFGLIPNSDSDMKAVQLFRVIPPIDLWASCDNSQAVRNITHMCQVAFSKILPLFGQAASSPPNNKQQGGFSVDEETMVHGPKSDGKPPRYVCARHAAAGLGQLTDHGHNDHGQAEEDYEGTHVMHGRGGQLFRFRNFMLKNIQMSDLDPTVLRKQITITFSILSSNSPGRRFEFVKQIDAVKQRFGSTVTVEVHQMSEIPLRQQIDLALRTNIYISAAGGGAVTAMFLPRGASIFLFYPEVGLLTSGLTHKAPARLDFGYFENAGYLRPNWFPVLSMDTREGLELFCLAVQREIESWQI